MQIITEFLWNFLLDEILFILNKSESDFKLFKKASKKVLQIFSNCAEKMDPKFRMTKVFWAAIDCSYENYDELANILNKNLLTGEDAFTETDINNSLNDAKNSISRCMRETYFNKLNTPKNRRKYQDNFLNIYVKNIDAKKIISSLCIDATKNDRINDLIAYANILATIGGKRATEDISKYFAEKIDHLIHINQYNDAVYIFNIAFKIDSDFSISAKKERYFILTINNTVVKIRKIWDFFNTEMKILVEEVVSGSGKLSFVNQAVPVPMVRGQQEDIGDTDDVISIRKAVLEIDDIYMNIYVDDSTLLIETDFDIDPVMLTDGKINIPCSKQFGQFIFHI